MLLPRAVRTPPRGDRRSSATRGTCAPPQVGGASAEGYRYLLHVTPGRRKATPSAQKGKRGADFRRVAQNRRARHDYDIIETYEAGIALQGSEVKSLREGRANLREAYARVDDGEAWLVGMHISPYANAVGVGAHDPERPRKLLLHRAEIDELMGRVKQQSLTLVPLSVYFRDGRAKVEIALARGRRLWDRRAAVAERDAARDAERELASARRGGSYR